MLEVAVVNYFWLNNYDINLLIKSEKERGELVAHLSKKRRLSPKGEHVHVSDASSISSLSSLKLN